jgi:hypothetical protein
MNINRNLKLLTKYMYIKRHSDVINITSFVKHVMQYKIYKLKISSTNGVCSKPAHSAVGTLTWLRTGPPRKSGSTSGKGKRVFSSPKLSGRLLSTSTLLFDRYGGKGPRNELTTHFHKVARLKVSGATSSHCEIASWRLQEHTSSARVPDWLLCANPTSAPAVDGCVNYVHSSLRTHLSTSAVRKYLSSNFHI